MGECGCAADEPEVRIEGADGLHYGIGVYGGCVYCHTGVFVDVYRYNDEDAGLWLSGTPEVKIDEYVEGQGTGQAVLPILEPEQLLSALKAHVDEDRGAAVADLDLQDVEYILQNAIGATREAWNDSSTTSTNDSGKTGERGS